MDPTNKTKPEETSETLNDINESEWCEYSGMPSPAYYMKHEGIKTQTEFDIQKQNSPQLNKLQ